MGTESENTHFYLFAKRNGASKPSSETVFYTASTEPAAATLCGLFRNSFGSKHEFSMMPVRELSFEERIRCDEALELLEIYSDPDPTIYEPMPSKELHQLAQYAVQANVWDELIARSESKPSKTSEKHTEQARSPEDPWSKIPKDERKNSGLILFWMLAQAYYKILEQTFSHAHMFVHLDLNLNHSYMWVIGNLSNLLKNHPDLRDFPIKFEPIFDNLYPSSIIDVDWEDWVQTDAEAFLSTAQRYITEKGIYELQQGSAGHVFVEIFRPSIESAIASAAAYSDRIRKHSKRVFESTRKSEEKNDAAPRSPNPKRFRVALSFAGERRYFVEEVAKHLATAFGKEKILYDKYHEAELACVNLDVHLQKLYHDESELVVIFVCSYYAQKEWCGLEWRALRDLIKQRASHMIMPFRFDQTEICGLFSTDGYVDVGHKTPRDAANLIINRLEINGCSQGP